MAEAKAGTDRSAIAALSDLESDMWDALYAVQVLDSRIAEHFGTTDGPDRDHYRVHFDDAAVTQYATNEAVKKARALTERFAEVFRANGGQA